MLRTALPLLSLVVVLAAPARADVPPFPASFQTSEIQTRGATIHVRVGGKGSAVVMLHGFGDTGDMWAPCGEARRRSHCRSA